MEKWGESGSVFMNVPCTYLHKIILYSHFSSLLHFAPGFLIISFRLCACTHHAPKYCILLVSLSGYFAFLVQFIPRESVFLTRMHIMRFLLNL